MKKKICNFTKYSALYIIVIGNDDSRKKLEE